MVPKVSVVIPLYNKEKHISRAIHSVLGQTFQDFEIVVIDDGSRDGSVGVVSGFSDDRIRLIRQKNAGVSAARNRGAEESHSDLVAFLDADDAFKPDFLENIFKLRELHPAAAAFAMNYEIVSPNGEVSLAAAPVKASPVLLRPDSFFRIAKYCTPIHSSAIAVPKKTLAHVGGFPVGVKLGEDIDTWIRLIFFGPIVFDGRSGAVYFRDAEERACIINPPPEKHVFFDTVDQWLAKQEIPSAELTNDIHDFKMFFVLAYAHYQIRWGQAEQGRRALLRCKTKTFFFEKWRLLLVSFLPRNLYGGLASLKGRLRRQ